MSTATEQPDVAPVRLLIVDDAPLMRKAIQQIMVKHEEIEVVGTAANGQECLEKIRDLKPDVITLDIDMPVMNGITAIKHIMVRHQIPIVTVSSLVQDGYFVFEALRLGVVDFVPKPSRVAADNWEGEEEILRRRVRIASGVRINRMRRVRRRKKSGAYSAPHDTSPFGVIVMGTTLGGPNSIMHIVTKLSSDFPGAVVAIQEIHPRILAPFCSSFNTISPLEVIPITEARQILPGKVYLGSTFSGINLDRGSNGSSVLTVAPADSTDFPIDRLFEAAAEHLKDMSCGVLLTGIGTDGTAGMRAIKDQGGLTIGQDQNCSIYPNLVEHAIQEQVVDVVMSNQGISDRLEAWIRAGHLNSLEIVDTGLQEPAPANA